MSLVSRSKEKIYRKFIQIIKRHGWNFVKLIVIVKVAISCILGTVLYLYNIHKDKESYALNILLTAFVSQVTGAEFLSAVKTRILRARYHILRIFFRRVFVDKPQPENRCQLRTYSSLCNPEVAALSKS